MLADQSQRDVAIDVTRSSACGDVEIPGIYLAHLGPAPVPDIV